MDQSRAVAVVVHSGAIAGDARDISPASIEFCDQGGGSEGVVGFVQVVLSVVLGVLWCVHVCFTYRWCT